MTNNYGDIVKRMFVDTDDILIVPTREGMHYNRAYSTLVLEPEYTHNTHPYAVIAIANWVYIVTFWTMNNGYALYNIKHTIDLNGVKVNE